MSRPIQKSFDTTDAMLQQAWNEMMPYWISREPKPIGIVLSGGSTPLPLYRQIAATAFPVPPSLHLILADERMVPNDSPQSNYGHMSAMVSACGFNEDQILRPQYKSDTSIPITASLYHRELDRFLSSGGRIPLGFFGLGPDGHTASLFTVQDASANTGQWAIPVYRDAPPNRVSITPAFIKQIDRCIFLVAGIDKREMVERLLHAPETIPAGLATKEAKHVEIWTVM